MALTLTDITTFSLLNALNRSQKGQSTAMLRLSTGLRINRGRDDPAGLIAASALEMELKGVESAISSNQRTDAMLDVAGGAIGEISTLLTEIQSLAIASANSSGITPDELAANQAQIDAAIDSINRIVSTTQFNGQKLLDGSLGITTSGVDSDDLRDVRIFSRNPNSTSTAVTVTLNAAAEQARLTNFATNSATTDTTISIQGPLGTAVIEISAGDNLSAVTAAINDATAATGVVASQTSPTGAISLRSQDYGSRQLVSVTVISGDSTNFTAGSDSGVDADVSVNGQSASTDGLNVNFSGAGLSFELNLTTAFNNSAPGSSSSFTVTGGGATFQLGTSTITRANLGIPGLFPQQLGSATLGYLTSLRSGGANSVLTNAGGAAAIATEALSQVTKAAGRVGGFQKYQVEPAINQLATAREGLQSAISVIKDADIAQETAELNRQKLLMETTLSLLGMVRQNGNLVLALLK